MDAEAAAEEAAAADLCLRLDPEAEAVEEAEAEAQEAEVLPTSRCCCHKSYFDSDRA
jgi:hypothetical protein